MLLAASMSSLSVYRLFVIWYDASDFHLRHIYAIASRDKHFKYFETLYCWLYLFMVYMAIKM